MGAFITALTSELTSANFWSELAPAAALVGVLVLFAFGYSRLRKVIKGASKGKANI